jgi:hypothetical protein
MSKGYQKRRKQIKAGTYEPHLRRAKSAEAYAGFYDSVIRQLKDMAARYESDPEFKKQIDKINKKHEN